MNTPLLFVGVAVGLFVTDFIWTELVVAVNKKRALRASALAVAFQLISGFVIIAYVDQPVLLIAAAIGGFAGTYMSVMRQSPD
jgi:hypothetical protein